MRKGGRFYHWDWQRKEAICTVQCFDSLSRFIECECIFHDSAVGVRELRAED